jgi:hypothetical protein
MTDMGDAQDIAESLDSDKLPDYDDPEGLLEYPPDHPLGVREYGTTAAEERVDEPLDERLRRDDRDEDDADEGTVGRLVEPGADDDGLATEDDEDEEVASSVDEEDLSAEEAAVHLTNAPPMRDLGDGYIDPDADVDRD